MPGLVVATAIGTIAVMAGLEMGEDVPAITEKSSQGAPVPTQRPRAMANLEPRPKLAPPTASAPRSQSKLTFEPPPVGRDNVLTVGQVRYCVREQVRIEAIRKVVTSNSQVGDFNRLVNDYNSRCGSYRYRQGTLERAKRDVESQRGEIAREARSRFVPKTLPPRSPRTTRSAVTSTARPHDPPAPVQGVDPSVARDTQLLLYALGYEPGAIDGLVGAETMSAIRQFQRQAGVPESGVVSSELLVLLKAAYEQKGEARRSATSERMVEKYASSPEARTASARGCYRWGVEQQRMVRSDCSHPDARRVGE